MTTKHLAWLNAPALIVPTLTSTAFDKQPAQRVVGASALGAIKARLDWPWATSPQQGAGNSWALKTLPTQAIL